MHKYTEDPRETMATTSPPGCDSPFVPTFLCSSSPSQLGQEKEQTEVLMRSGLDLQQRSWKGKELLTGLNLETF